MKSKVCVSAFSRYITFVQLHHFRHFAIACDGVVLPLLGNFCVFRMFLIKRKTAQTASECQRCSSGNTSEQTWWYFSKADKKLVTVRASPTFAKFHLSSGTFVPFQIFIFLIILNLIIGQSFVLKVDLNVSCS